MTQGNPIFLGSSEIGVFGKERDYRGIEIAEPTAVEGDADQQTARLIDTGKSPCRHRELSLSPRLSSQRFC